MLSYFLRSNFSLSQGDLDKISSFFSPFSLHKTHHFLHSGDQVNSILFVSSGVLRTHWYDDAGNDITNHFFHESQFLVPLESYLYGKPSPVSIQAITDCELLLLSLENEKTLAKELPSWMNIFNKIMQVSLAKKIAEKNQLKGLHTKERYQQFFQTHADIALRTPLHYIASYLDFSS
ncbi:Crp/Fnr family transcriptional regulator [Chitinophaga silvisoli]|uniref:Crp/Fnr family transcriptional regulator n=1 Tax=Chitinophaga silvisoli TaxID=2291814 RepID=A0A3E1P8J4_9BACT|nr:cyclic nucleotide-binding domain-containing protein [Chitinophaga silvisoli]RFM36515.1 Crp/Fnr family transcriptional regulator [Chitinophaga silvisoli]